MSTSFAWVLSGDTWMYKDEIKKMGFHWQNSQGVWAKAIEPRDFEGNAKLRRWFRSLRNVTVTEELADRYVVGSRRWYKPNWG